MDFINKTKSKYNMILNSQQSLAVRHVEGPALVLAGPGSGKTTVIASRAACLIEHSGVRPEEILTVTYNKAAQLEMNNRFNRIFEREGRKVARFSTLHSFCYSVLKDYELKQGKRFRLIEGSQGVCDTSKSVILKSIYKEINQRQINDEELDNLISEIGLVKNKMILESQFSNESFQTPNFHQIFKSYEEYKRSNLYIDFDDMLVYAFSVLKRCPEILKNYKSRFRFYQIDEAQDLSRVQFEILKLLTYPENNIFLVADDDQSIYGFRGAEPGHVLGIRSQYPGCSIYMLENNYRSSQNIVELSSSFIKSNGRRIDKNHFTGNPRKLPPKIVEAPNQNQQQAYLVSRIIEQKKENKSAEIAILYRNNLSSIPLIDALERAGIAYRLRQSKVYFHRHWLVQDVIAFLKFSMIPDDREAFSRIYYKMNRFISKSMNEAAIKTNEGTVLDTIIHKAEISPFQKKQLYKLRTEFRKLSAMRPVKALEYIEEDFKYLTGVKEYCENTGQSFNSLYRLFDILKTIASDLKSVPAFINRLEELEAILGKAEMFRNSESVMLSTFHASKGLEFDSVYMIDLVNEEIPGQKALNNYTKSKDASLLEEERRLFYVGMTRARTNLCLIYPQKRNGLVQARSTFINEVMSILNDGSMDSLKEGMVIRHRKYGQGILLSVEQSEGSPAVIHVDFQGKQRSLDLAICLESGIITLE